MMRASLAGGVLRLPVPAAAFGVMAAVVEAAAAGHDLPCEGCGGPADPHEIVSRGGREWWVCETCAEGVRPCRDR